MNHNTIPVAHIVCHDLDNVIGRRDTNEMPWKCLEELKYFREKTLNKICIMGYNTYRSILQNPLHLNTIKPTLARRICIVIADPSRMPYLEDNIVYPDDLLQHYNFSRSTTYNMEDTNEYDLEGHTSFVTRLSDALNLAESFSNILNQLCETGSDTSSPVLNHKWRMTGSDPRAFIIGGGRFYSETLQHANVTRIYETILPITCKVKTAVKYPAIDLDKYVEESHDNKIMDIVVGSIKSWRVPVTLKVWKLKT